MTASIPVYWPDGTLARWASEAWVEEHAGNLRVVRTRRAQRAVRAYLRGDDDGATAELLAWLAATGRRSDYGEAFRQRLDNGRRCWALRGTPGSR